MLNRMFVVSSATLTSTGTAVSCMVPFDTTCMKMPTQIVVKATGQGAYVRLSNDASVATNADVLVQGGDHVVLSVNGRQYVSVLSDGASSTVSIGALSTGVWGDAMPLPTALFGAGQKGAWYDPSDSTTLFSDTAGTTPSPTPGAGALSVVGKMLDKSGNGNHAISYNTTTARPELSARVNLLTYSEDQSNGVWVNYNATQQSNAGIAPDGTNTADRIIETSGAAPQARYQSIGAGLSIQYTVSAYAKAGERSVFNLSYSGTAGANWFAATFDLTGNGQVTKTGAGASGTYTSSSITPVGNGWYRCQVTGNTNQVSGHFVYGGPSDTTNPTYAGFGVPTYTGNTSNGVLVWGFDVRPANIGTSVPVYQRIADQYTYDSSGFPRYLVFNGTASGMYTPANLNLSGTDKATVFVGVRKTTTNTGVVAETSAIASSNNGAFLGLGTDSGGIEFFAGSRGTAYIDVFGDSASYTSPFSAVTTAAFNIAAPSAQLRVNAVVTETDVGSQGTGNYGSYPLNIGARNASSGTPSFFFPGFLYSLIVVGAASTAAQISSTESWINVKEGGVY